MHTPHAQSYSVALLLRDCLIPAHLVLASGKHSLLFSCLSGFLKDKKDKKDKKVLKEQKSSDKKVQKLKVKVQKVQKKTKKDKITKSK